MKFEWEQYICLACKLIKSGQFTLFYKASLRSAISRSYYGVYGVAATYLLEYHADVPSIPDKDPHRFVRDKFQSSSNMGESKVGENMRRLWRGRKDSDYDDNFDVDQNNAEKNLLIAINTITDLKELKINKHPIRKI